MSSTDDIANVLLIDDDEVDRASVRRSLAERKANIALTECASVDAAMARLSKGSYACVLMDYLLPGTNALELLPTLHAKLDGAPVIVLTGHGDEQLAVELMKAGASDYISKDRLDPRGLERAISQAISLGSTRRRLERAEREQHVYLARLRALVELTPALYGDRTLEGRLRIAARGAVTLFGAEQAFIGLARGEESMLCVTQGDEIVPVGPGDEPWRELFANAPRSGTEVREWPGRDDARLHSYPLFSSERKWMGVIGVRLPDSPSVFAELAESLLAQLGEMLAVAVENADLYDATTKAVSARDAVMAVVSHDLRSPLSSFGLGIDLVREADEAGTHHPVLDRMQRAATHMNRLIDDLLDVSRIERRELQVTPSDFSLPGLFEELHGIHAPLAEAGKVSLLFGPSPDIQVHADRHRLVQVLSNLISNALKFSPRGRAVHIDVQPKEGEVLFSVADEGPGIGTDQLPRLFGRFYRQGGKGLGLGLYIAKAIVDAHGGRIWAESEPGHGTRFQFTLQRTA